MQNCDTCQELLSAYLDGELDGVRRAEVAVHLLNCAECQRQLEQLQLMTQVIQSELVREAAPLGLELRILAEIQDGHRASQGKRLVVVYVMSLVVAIGALIWTALSPVGRVAGALFHLIYSATQSIWHLALGAGVAWPSVLVILFLFIGVMATVGLIRMLRTTEVAT